MTQTVSIVIPCYNQAAYLGSALRSVVSQTFTDWEVIVVDDGSSDDLHQVLLEFPDPRIQSIRQANQGLSSARNAGLAAVQGEYVVFLDADDELGPQFLQSGVAVLQKSPAASGVYCRNYFIDTNGDVLPQTGGEMVAPEEFRNRNLEGGFFPIHAAITRTEVVREVGMFDTSLTSEEDWDLWLRISAKHMMYSIAMPLVIYRVYPGSMSTNIERMHTNRLMVLRKYFSDFSGEVVAWTLDKRRAYGFAFRATALGYIQQCRYDDGWHFLERAVDFYPDVLTRVDTYYELLCREQLPGYRGGTDAIDIEGNSQDMLARLTNLFNTRRESIYRLDKQAFALAYLAIGMLHDQAGHWLEARQAFLNVVRFRPALLANGHVLVRLVKLLAGRRLGEMGKRIYRTSRTLLHPARGS